MKFIGQTALISGGLGDIGRAIALELAAGGADIALCDLQSAGEADKNLAELRRHRRRVTYDLVDVSDATAVQAWVERVEASLGPPSLIVPCAAQVTAVNLRELSPEQWDRELRVNLHGAFYTARSAALALAAHRRPGRIVFVGSWAGHRVHTNIPAYVVAKAALRMLCQCLALEFASQGILVNEVAPGFVDAGLSAQLMNRNGGLREAMRSLTPVGRLIEPREVAQTVAFLCDPENRQITGAAIVQDGGLSLLPPQV